MPACLTPTARADVAARSIAAVDRGVESAEKTVGQHASDAFPSRAAFGETVGLTRVGVRSAARTDSIANRIEEHGSTI